METVLGWIAVGIGAAVSVIGFAAGSRSRDESPVRGLWTAAIVSLVATVVLFLLTLPVRPPVFSLGTKLGYGILIGGILGTLAGLRAMKVEGSQWASQLSVAGIAGLATLGTGLVLVIFKNYPQPALGGFLIGAVASAVIFRLTLAGSERIDIWSIAATAAGATALLATFRYDSVENRFWWDSPAVLLAAAAVAVTAAAGLIRPGRRASSTAIAAAIITIALAAVFTWRMFPEWPFLWVAVAGIATVAFTTWLAAPAASSNAAAALVAILVAAFSAAAFKLLGGFGIGLGLIAAFAVVMPLEASAQREQNEDQEYHPERTVLYALFVGAAILLLRLFLETYSGELRGLDLRTHYTSVALIFGAVLPFLLISAFPSPASSLTLRTVNAGMTGIVAAASPLLVAALWGYKAELGFFIGTVVSMVFLLFTNTGIITVNRRDIEAPAVLVITAQISAVQLSGLVAPFADEPRATRIWIMAVVLLIGLAWAGISTLAVRRNMREA